MEARSSDLRVKGAQRRPVSSDSRQDEISSDSRSSFEPRLAGIFDERLHGNAVNSHRKGAANF